VLLVLLMAWCSSWFEHEEGGEGRCCVARSVGSLGVLVLPRFLPGYFLPPRSGVGHLVCETFLCAVAEACITLRLREEKSGCGTHPTILSLVTCTRQLYPSTRRRVSSATLRAVLRFLPELLLHSPLAEKGQ